MILFALFTESASLARWYLGVTEIGGDVRLAPGRETTLSAARKRNGVMTDLWRASAVRW